MGERKEKEVARAGNAPLKGVLGPSERRSAVELVCAHQSGSRMQGDWVLIFPGGPNDHPYVVWTPGQFHGPLAPCPAGQTDLGEIPSPRRVGVPPEDRLRGPSGTSQCPDKIMCVLLYVLPTAFRGDPNGSAASCTVRTLDSPVGPRMPFVARERTF